MGALDIQDTRNGLKSLEGEEDKGQGRRRIRRIKGLGAVEGEEGWAESSGIRGIQVSWGWRSKMHRMDMGEQ